MATDIDQDVEDESSHGIVRPAPDSPWADIVNFLSPLASLKLTVASMAAAIFLILAGTLAQIELDMSKVLEQYFRTQLAWIDPRVFFPRAWFYTGAARFMFPFPGGFTIGGVMLLNLLAAHLLRFKMRARGARLVGGISVIAVGVLATWLVIVSGSNKEGVQDLPLLPWSTVWTCFKLGLAVLWGATIFGLLKTDAERPIERLGLAVLAGVLGVAVAGLYYYGDSAMLGDSSMRILWQLLKALCASIVLLAGCVLLFQKRAGIVLLHAGVALMMINEIVVYGLHQEGMMQIQEGQTVDYSQDLREIELAIIDPSGDEVDDVTVVPNSRLKEGERISDPQLPFDVEVVEFLQNSKLRRLKPGEPNKADAGTGLKFVAEPERAGAGTDTDSKVDMSSAYVRLSDKQTGQPLGTFLVGIPQTFDGALEKVTVGDKTYDVALRLKRHYKPYAVKLVDVRTDYYPETKTPRNYSSDIRLVDPTRNVDRTAHIWMNNPLRYAGETLYQSGAPEGTDITVLQVVTNTGWMIPYVACVIVLVGMLAQFSITLLRFLYRRSALNNPVVGPTPIAGKFGKHAPRKAAPAAAPAAASIADWLLPCLVVGLAAMTVASGAKPKKSGVDQFDLQAFGELPVMYQGRIKPMDTLARNSLRVISDSDSYVNAEGHREPAIQWLLNVIADPTQAEAEKVLRIHNLEVLNLFNLSRRKGYRYSVDELRDGYPAFSKALRAAHEVRPELQSAYEKKLIELEHRVMAYQTLQAAFEPPNIGLDEAPQELIEKLQRHDGMIQAINPPRIIPPEGGLQTWEPYSKALSRALLGKKFLQQEPPRAISDLAKAMADYAGKDAKAFNGDVREYQSWLAAHPPENLNPKKIEFEAFFNRARPFFWATWLYVVAFALAALAWLGWARPLNRAAFWLLVFTFGLHTAALVGRIYISGRPPVTNLYSSAVFIGWGSVALGLILERVYRLGIGSVVAAVAGFATLVIAEGVPGIGVGLAGDDTFTVLQAVLDTQFWLATHVTCITFGYATTYVAGLLGVIYILGGVLSSSLKPRIASDLARMIYGTICFAIFFSFVGTVLGGLWADDSWGRFWGWDPKENGALIIVLWNALVLHARWDGMVKDRGLAVLAVLGNVCVSWSWFGVNQLSVGLHSYGFTEGIALALVTFVGSQLLIAGLGTIPRRMWRS
ncbi:MAG TPA: cytochrome c biogenesis protein CcsA [Pirellulales bacterium]|jgi:ABC-type transport system involved in cytochrome c biogenesis permease subunit